MIVIAPDKFKGTLSATQAADAIAGGLRDAGVADTLRLYPMADGGDGTAAVLAGLIPEGTCVVETHQHIGPACFSCKPAARSSFALGVEIGRALERWGRVLVGIGGTACCDGGAGMLQALGLRAFRADGSEIAEHLTPDMLLHVAAVDASALPAGAAITALSDVRASLAPSPDSALSALDFALQKGFAPDYIPQLSRALAHWHSLVAPGLSSPIDGAGGGVGFALATVLGAEVRSGAEFVADAYDMSLAGARLVISGEGRIDAQSGAGKVVAEMARRASAAGVPFLAIGGSVAGAHPFSTLAVDSPGTPLPSSPAEAAARLRRAVAAYFHHE